MIFLVFSSIFFSFCSIASTTQPLFAADGTKPIIDYTGFFDDHANVFLNVQSQEDCTANKGEWRDATQKDLRYENVKGYCKRAENYSMHVTKTDRGIKIVNFNRDTNEIYCEFEGPYVNGTSYDFSDKERNRVYLTEEIQVQVERPGHSGPSGCNFKFSYTYEASPDGIKDYASIPIYVGANDSNVEDQESNDQACAAFCTIPDYRLSKWDQSRIRFLQGSRRK